MSNVINHSERPHAVLSASGSSRWLNCPGSVDAEKDIPNPSSSFALEGTLAHELADTCLKNKCDADDYVGKEITGDIIQKDMASFVQEYLDYVRSYETANSTLYTEERVDFSNVVPDGFGTMDAAVILPDGTCHIFDLKYGQGVVVSAENNTQGLLYAIGLHNYLDFLGGIEKFIIHIVQPRVSNYSVWEVSVDKLKEFAKWASKRAKLALSNNAPRIPGEKQCQWCRAKSNCLALSMHVQSVIMAEFDNETELLDIADLTDGDKKAILDNTKLIETFLKAVKADVHSRIEQGQDFNGYKLVSGKANRKWTDNAHLELEKELGDDAYTKKPITITEAQKLLGKKRVDELTYKPTGSPTLVPSSDKRQSISYEPVEDCFEVIKK